MEIKITKDFIPLSKEKRTGKKIKFTEICIHSTGNANSTAKNERGWLTNPSNNVYASWHLCIDEKDCIMAIPLDEQAYHAGDSFGNNYSIGIEICESGDRAKTLERAVALTKQLMKEYNIPLEKVKRHYDYSGKSCPRILMDNNWKEWNSFKEKLKQPTTPTVKDTVLIEAVLKLNKGGVIGQPNDWNDLNKIVVANAEHLIKKFCKNVYGLDYCYHDSVKVLVSKGVLSDSTLWLEQVNINKSHVRSLVVKLASII